MGEGANILKQLKHSSIKISPFQILQVDFTRVIYDGGKKFLWLCPYVEYVTKIVCGFSLEDRADTATALKAWAKTKSFLKRKKFSLMNLIIHQDQGSPFISYEYVGQLTGDGVILSYSDAGKPSDNAEEESFIGRLKVEWREVFLEAKTEREIIALVAEAIKYYNHKRIHSKLNGLSPFKFLKTLKI